MRILKYDLSKEKVPDDLLRKWFRRAGYGEAVYISRRKVDDIDTIVVRSAVIEMYFTGLSNLVTCRNMVETQHYLHPREEIKIMEELFNSQWIGPNVKLPPAAEEKVIIKINTPNVNYTENIRIVPGFIFRNYHGSSTSDFDIEVYDTDDYEYDIKDVIGWVPAGIAVI